MEVNDFYDTFKYKVCETFKSMQGEGTNTGRMATFIRLSGCNLKCSFCDEPKHKDSSLAKEMQTRELVSIVRTNETFLTVITGGEPTLHNCNPLISQLQKIGNKVAIETNGLNLVNAHRADLITWSPKTLNYSSFMRSIDALVSSPSIPSIELKIPYLYGDEELLIFVDRVTEILDEHIVAKFITPINDMKTLDMDANKKAFEFCMKYPEFSFNMQTHKILEVE